MLTHHMNIIESTDALRDICNALASDRFITVDTEFMREQTYWPELCLIQIAGEDQQVLIDPMSDGLDLSPFYELMANTAVVKVFHAARQDVEIIYHRSGNIPAPLFDTQLAAMVCGFGDQVGYEALARRLANARIDKSSRFTDWSRRPLTDKQLAYALSDVTHLRVIYEKLKKQLDISRRETWLDEELDTLTSPATYENNPEDAWMRIKFRSRKKAQLGVLRSLAAWREREAKQRNVPRNRILKDDALAELAVQMPRETADLRRLRAMPKGYAHSKMADQILKAVADGLAADLSTLPDVANDRDPAPEGASAIADILKLALKVISERDGIAAKLIASSADLERLAAGQEDVRLMHGWRKEIFGNLALDLRAGRLAITVRDGRPDIVPASACRPSIKAAE